VSLTIEFSGGDPADSPFARFSFMRGAVAWADEIGPVVREALKAEAPVSKDTMDGRTGGRLRDSIRYERETAAGTVSAVFTANTPYAGYVLSGTLPHAISAVAARYLRYELPEGHYVFRRRVWHPGTQPDPFNVRAVTPLTVELRSSFAEAMQASAEGA